MFSRNILMAALIGFFVDYLLTSILFVVGMLMIGINDPLELNFSNLGHLIVGLLIPGLCTLVGGAVAGAAAPLNPRPAGALVGGLGLMFMLFFPGEQNGFDDLLRIITQCIVTVLAAFTAAAAANYRLSKLDNDS